MIQVPQNDEHKEARYTRFWNTHFEQDRLQLFVLFFLSCIHFLKSIQIQVFAIFFTMEQMHLNFTFDITNFYVLDF